ncbi:MAG: T9SS type A sorting domain-containing protein [Bacteroidota bacterium]|nr:T9SS type A sorting domain-containing protein [Bacteroidota bacterium]
MKNLKFLSGLIFILVFFAFNNEPVNVNSAKTLDANSITTAYTNYGLFNYGIEEAHFNVFGNDLRAISGIWIGATVNSQIRLAVSEFTHRDYLPGYIDIGENPQGKDDPLYRVYKIIEADTISKDYLHWPINQGAYLNNLGKPYLMGKQTLFYSYTDGYPEAHNLTQPLKVQILQTNWAYELAGPLSVTVFSELRIINKSNDVWNETYIGFWTDDEIGDATDDGVCSDSAASLGLTYNIDNNNSNYGAAPPAVGFKILSGPFKYTGSNNDSVVYYLPPGSNNKIVKRGYKNLYASSNNIIINGSPTNGDPVTTEEYYNVLKGLKRNGQPWINQVTNERTNFPCSMENNIGGDLRFLLSSGPLNINPGDTQVVVIAQLVARGGSNLQSISELERSADLVQNIFDCNFCNIPNEIVNAEVQLPNQYKLYQNYPNPFNPVTKIKYSLPKPGTVKLIVYDIQGKEVEVLKDSFQEAGDKEATFDASGLASGIYFYKLTINNLSTTLKMVLQK